MSMSRVGAMDDEIQDDDQQHENQQELQQIQRPTSSQKDRILNGSHSATSSHSSLGESSSSQSPPPQMAYQPPQARVQSPEQMSRLMQDDQQHRNQHQQQQQQLQMQQIQRPTSSQSNRRNSTGFRGDNSGEESCGCCGIFLMIFSYFLVIILLPFSLCMCIKMVQEYERAVIFRLGRIKSGEAQGPGMFFILPCIDSMEKVDLRTKTFNIPPQEILSKDTVTVSVDAVIYASIFNPVLSVCQVMNAMHATTLLAATTLRNVLGTRTMAEMLQDREKIAIAMQSSLDEATDVWGIKVERIEIKDVKLPHMLQRAMAAEAEASREAKAKVMAAEGEHMAARALKEAADIISSSPSALQLRYLQTLSSVAAEKNSTIVFPIPINLTSGLIPK